MSFIQNLQNKTSKEKRKLLWIFVIAGTAIIFILWIVALPKDYLKKSESQKSFQDLKDDFENSEENINFEEYMNSLEIFENFEDGMDIESVFEEAQDINSSNQQELQGIIGDELDPKEEYFNRLPLEQDE